MYNDQKKDAKRGNMIVHLFRFKTFSCVSLCSHYTSVCERLVHYVQRPECFLNVLLKHTRLNSITEWFIFELIMGLLWSKDSKQTCHNLIPDKDMSWMRANSFFSSVSLSDLEDPPLHTHTHTHMHNRHAMIQSSVTCECACVQALGRSWLK